MGKRIIHCEVTNEYVKGSGVFAGVAGSMNDVVLSLEFGPMWNGLNKEITFRNALGENPVRLFLADAVYLAKNTDNVYIVPVPPEAKAEPGNMSVSIKGYEMAKKFTEAAIGMLLDDTYTGIDPSDEGWYEYVNGKYVLSQDTEYDEEKTYYTETDPDQIESITLSVDAFFRIDPSSFDFTGDETTITASEKEQLLAAQHLTLLKANWDADTARAASDAAWQSAAQAEEAKDAAETAQGLAEDAQGLAEDAQDAAEAAEAEAKKWATGEGVRVFPGVPENDPQYRNNAKYYAQFAEAWARGTVDGDEIPIEEEITDPIWESASAEPAYGSTSSKSGGANNGSDVVEEETDIEESESRPAAGTGSPSPFLQTARNNAKYYAELAGERASEAKGYKEAAAASAAELQEAVSNAAGSASSAQQAAKEASDAAGEAKTARKGAEDAQDAAEAAAENAGKFAEEAGDRAAEAQEAVGTASSAAGEAKKAQDAAETAREGAEDAQEAAETAAKSAGESAEEAGKRVIEAQGSAEAAGNSAAEAEDYAEKTAEDKKAAAASADSAALSAENAATYSDAAGEYADIAKEYAGLALGSNITYDEDSEMIVVSSGAPAGDASNEFSDMDWQEVFGGAGYDDGDPDDDFTDSDWSDIFGA